MSPDLCAILVNTPLYLCSTIAFTASKRDVRSEWFVSFARRKLGNDIDAKSWSSFKHDNALIFSKYAAMLFMMARSAE